MNIDVTNMETGVWLTPPSEDGHEHYELLEFDNCDNSQRDTMLVELLMELCPFCKHNVAVESLLDMLEEERREAI